MEEKTWHPIAAVVVAGLLGIPFWLWGLGDNWFHAIAYAAVIAGGAMLLYKEGANRTFAAFLIAGAAVFAWLVPIPWLDVQGPEPVEG